MAFMLDSILKRLVVNSQVDSLAIVLEFVVRTDWSSVVDGCVDRVPTSDVGDLIGALLASATIPELVAGSLLHKQVVERFTVERAIGDSIAL